MTDEHQSPEIAEPADLDQNPEIERLSPRDRLRQRKIRTKDVNVGDDETGDIWVEVRGLSADAAFSMGDDFDDDEEPTAREAVPALVKKTAFDKATGERFFDDSWEDEEILALPVDVVNSLAEAANEVLGRTSAPGKG